MSKWEVVEAFVLAGGSSTRMGSNKASLHVGDTTMIRTIVQGLLRAGMKATIVGGQALDGLPFLPDKEPGAGPLRAVASLVLSKPFFFLASCDLPAFDARIVSALFGAIQNADAALPCIQGRLQPLCALYRAGAIEKAPTSERKVMRWIDSLCVNEVSEADLLAAGIDPLAALGVNTPAEFERAVKRT